MPIIKQSGIFYEIIIRGVHPDTVDKSQKLGQFAGAQFIEAEALIDTDTNDVIQFKPGNAQVLPREKIIDYLGDRFATFEEQARAAQAAADVAVKDIADRDATINDLKAQLAALNTAHQTVTARNAAAAAALNG